MMRILNLAARVVALASLVSAEAALAQPSAVAWVQLVGGSAAEVRAVAPGERCPTARVDGEVLALSLRAGPAPGFPTSVCTARLPEGARTVSVDGRRLKAPPRTLRRVLILGDTGCRLKGANIQACNDPRAWPYSTVARLAAAKRPDLIIHVGDYYYRETACPAGEAGCVGSPHGDAQASWDADFLGPARPLLAVAPWVFVRGNHESCSRGALGWFRMFDAGAEPMACPSVSAPFRVSLPGLTLLVTDGADADDRLPSAQQVASFERQVDGVTGQGRAEQGPTWLLTHRPIWALVPALRLGPLGPIEVAINSTEQQGLRGRPLDGVDMIVSGHIHHFATYDFGGLRPAQLVVGTGGDVGEKADSPVARGGRVTIDGAEADRFTFYRYGYLLLERSGAGWTGAFHDVNDRVAATCRAEGRGLRCRSVAR